jgi:hypothetical protein
VIGEQGSLRCFGSNSSGAKITAEQRDYFGAQIVPAAASCLFRIQKIFDFVGSDSVDRPLGVKVRL